MKRGRRGRSPRLATRPPGARFYPCTTLVLPLYLGQGLLLKRSICPCGFAGQVQGCIGVVTFLIGRLEGGLIHSHAVCVSPQPAHAAIVNGRSPDTTARLLDEPTAELGRLSK